MSKYFSGVLFFCVCRTENKYIFCPRPFTFRRPSATFKKNTGEKTGFGTTGCGMPSVSRRSPSPPPQPPTFVSLPIRNIPSCSKSRLPLSPLSSLSLVHLFLHFESFRCMIQRFVGSTTAVNVLRTGIVCLARFKVVFNLLESCSQPVYVYWQCLDPGMCML